MGPTARGGLIFAMIALMVVGQLVEREFARRRKAARDAAPAAASLYGELLKPLPDATLPGRPAGPRAPGAEPVAGRSETDETTYVIQPGDTLARIAKKLLGTEGAWKAIYDQNRRAIPDPARLQVGTSLHIPRRERPVGR